MVIKLKNNKNIKLDWSYLCLEFLEEYPGGINQLQKDFKSKIHPVKTMNALVSAIIRANYDEIIDYYESIRLVEYQDYPKIMDFIDKNSNEVQAFKKKQHPYPNQFQKKRK